eukprot:jgi/Tetstr1/447929/TSEL_035236.t1
MLPAGANRKSVEADASPLRPARSTDAGAAKGVKKLAIHVPAGEGSGRSGAGSSGGVARPQSAALPARRARMRHSVSVKESANITHNIPTDTPASAERDDGAAAHEPLNLRKLANVGKAVTKLGFGDVDMEEEFQVLLSLGVPNSNFRAPAPTEDADTWDVLAETCLHNRCFTFGVDQYGQLGQGVTASTSSKGTIRAPRCVKEGQRLMQLSCGRHHSAAATEDGHLYVWGLNDKNQLGLGKGQPGDGRVLPVIAKSPSSAILLDPSAGPRIINSTAKCLDLEEELIQGLGLDKLKEAPLLPTASRVASTPVRCWLGLPVARVACGQAHTLVSLRAAGVLAWGENDMGQLGLEGAEPRSRPTLVPAFNAIRVTALAAGKLHSCAVDTHGQLYAWGCNRAGQCGVMVSAVVVEPREVRIVGQTGSTAAVAAGQAHTLALSTSGELFSWGYNAWGALGLGPPIAASVISMAVTTQGQLLVWGRNKWISHPREEVQAQCVPQPLDWLAGERISQVCCSVDTAVALAEDGAIHVWGRKKQLMRDTHEPGQGRSKTPLLDQRMAEEEIKGEAAGGLTENVMMRAACGEGYCVLLADGEFWQAPHSVLKRALHSVWKIYRHSVGKIVGGTKGATRGGRLRTRLEEQDDGVMTFSTLLLMCKEMALIDNAVGVQQLVMIYEEVAREAASTYLARLPKFMQVAVSAFQLKQPASKAPLGKDASSRNWETALTAISQRKEREGLVFEIQEETSDLNVAAAPADVPTIRGPGRKSKREPAAHIGDGKGHEMKQLSTQIQAEMQARVALLETPLAFNEALAVMLGLASCHLPKETDETELLRLVAEQAARLQDRALEGPSFLLRESCSPALVKAVANASDYKMLKRIFAYLLSPHPDREDLNMPIADIDRALSTLGDSAGITLLAVATFMREANLVPKLLAQYASARQQQEDPELYRLAQEVALRDGSQMEKSAEDRVTEEALAHRDKILAEIMFKLHGGNPHLDPDCISFPDFISLVLLLVTVRSCSNNNRAVREEELDLSSQTMHYEHLMQRVKLYRERKLQPWRFLRRQRTDAEIEQEVDRVFALYCTLDTTSYSVEIDQRSFRKFAKDAKLVDNRTTVPKMDILFISHVNQTRRREEEEEQSRRGSMINTGFPLRKSGVMRRSTESAAQPPQLDATAPSAVAKQASTLSRAPSARRRTSSGKQAKPGASSGTPEIMKLAKALKKSELGGLVRAMKSMNNDSSGNSQREAIRLAADLMKGSGIGGSGGNNDKVKRMTSRKRSGNAEFQLGQLKLEQEEQAGSRPQSMGQRVSMSSGLSKKRLNVSREESGRGAHFAKGSIESRQSAVGLSLEDKAGVGHTGKRPTMRKRAVAVDRAAFGSCLEQIAAVKYKKEPKPYRFLVEKHLLSISHAVMDRYDDMMEQLLEPEVLDLAERYSGALQQIYKSYCTLDDCLAYSHAEVTWQMMEDANSTLSFKEFAFLSHDFGIVPGLITIRDLETIFRRANTTDGNDDSIQHMNYSEFVDAVGLIAMYGYGKGELKDQYPTPFDKVKALFGYMGFQARPAAVPRLTLPPACCHSHPSISTCRPAVVPLLEGKADEEEDAKKTAHGEVAYKEWWALQAKSFANKDSPRKRVKEPGKRWYYSSTTAYPTCLIPEIVTAPRSPPEVEAHITQAQALHQKGRFPEALAAYSAAKELWSRVTAEQGLTRSGELRPETKLFFAAACGGVLQSDGQDAAAMAVYSQVENEVRKLPDHHPDVALLHSLIGAAAYHMGQYEEAYVRFVRTKVMRDSLPQLGPDHVDTAVACNNLACVLDKANLVGRAIFLAREAHKVLLEKLGSAHPRTKAVERNLGHLGHRTFNFEEMAGPLLPHPATQHVIERLKVEGRDISTPSVPANAMALEAGTSRLDRLHERVERNLQSSMNAKGPAARRRLKALMERQPDAVKSTYEALRDDIELTRQGLNHNQHGQVLSGDVSTMTGSDSLMMRAGFNLRLKEPPPRTKFDRIQVRTTKKFQAVLGKGKGGVKVGKDGAMIYEAVLDEQGRRLRRAPTMDDSDDSFSDDSDSSDY